MHFCIKYLIMKQIVTLLFAAVISVSAVAQSTGGFSVAASTGLFKATNCPLDYDFEDLTLNTYSAEISMNICTGINGSIQYAQSFDFPNTETDFRFFRSGGLGLDYRGTDAHGWAVGPIVGISAEYGRLANGETGYDFSGFNSGLRIGVGAKVASMLQLELTAKTLLPVYNSDSDFQTEQDIFYNSINLGLRYDINCGACCKKDGKACCKKKEGKACCKKKNDMTDDAMEMPIEEKSEEEMEAEIEAEMARMEAEMAEMEAQMEMMEDEMEETEEQLLIEEVETVEVPNNVEIYFDNSSASLSVDQKLQLASVVSFLNENADYQVGVTGYANKLGASDKNEALSAQRAEAVRQYLINQGINDTRIFKRAFGDKYSQETPDYRKVIIEIL